MQQLIYECKIAATRDHFCANGSVYDFVQLCKFIGQAQALPTVPPPLALLNTSLKTSLQTTT